MRPLRRVGPKKNKVNFLCAAIVPVAVGWDGAGCAEFSLSLLLHDVSRCCEDLVMLPSVSPLAKCGLAPCRYMHQHASLFTSLAQWNLIPPLSMFVGVGRVSYTDQSRTEM